MTTGGLGSLHLDVDSLKRFSLEASKFVVRSGGGGDERKNWCDVGAVLGGVEKRQVHSLYDSAIVQKKMRKVVGKLLMPADDDDDENDVEGSESKKY